MHIRGVVAELPAGRRSDASSPLPWTKNGSLPATTDAAPLRSQPAAPNSKPPSGTNAEDALSPQGAKGCASGSGQEMPRPARAGVAVPPKTTAAASAAVANSQIVLFT